jgi:hypothetical protein
MNNSTKKGQYVPGVGSAVYLPYRQSMYEECLGPVCTIECTDSALGNLTVMTAEESLTGPFVSVSDYSFATPACTDACAKQDLEVLNVNVAENGPGKYIQQTHTTFKIHWIREHMKDDFLILKFCSFFL